MKKKNCLLLANSQKTLTRNLKRVPLLEEIHRVPGLGFVRARAVWFYTSVPCSLKQTGQPSPCAGGTPCCTCVTPPVSPGSDRCALGGATSVLAFRNGGHQPAKLSRKEGVAGESWVTERGPPGKQWAASTCPTSSHSTVRSKECWIGFELPPKVALKKWKGRQVTCMFCYKKNGNRISAF